ncbi:MAG: hypothetical protein FJ405_09240, partial [Verrucomicrobia bacterium]|nr:hypothetical protein [Verrucomicrobiota bacterium]
MAAKAEKTEMSVSADVVEQMTVYQKLSCLLILLGSDSAAAVLKGLTPQEIEIVSVEMAKIGLMDASTQEAILKQFSDVAIEAATSVRGGVD